MVIDQLLDDHRVFEVLKLSFLVYENGSLMLESLSVTTDISPEMLNEIIQIEEAYSTHLIELYKSTSSTPSN